MEAPVNNKSLFAFIANQMKKLDNKEVTAEEAKAMAALAGQAGRCFDREYKRVEVQVKLDEHLSKISSDLRIRNVESKGFDDVEI